MAIVFAAPFITITDDFESYAAGAFFPNGNWTLEQGGATYSIVDTGYAPMPSQHLKAAMTSETASYITHDGTGTITDGKLQAEITMEDTGNPGNRQPGLLMRYQGTGDYVGFKLSTFTGGGAPVGLAINDRVGGVSNNTTTAYTWVTNTVYYLDAIITGTSAVANVYSDAARTNLLVSTSKTITTANGKIGIAAIGLSSFHYDNFDFNS